MPGIDDYPQNLWIPCPIIALRYGQEPGFVAVPLGEHAALIAAGEAQDCNEGAMHFREIGDCSGVTPPPEPSPSPPALMRRRVSRTREEPEP